MGLILLTCVRVYCYEEPVVQTEPKCTEEPKPTCSEEIELIHINEPEPICTEEIELIHINEPEPICTEEIQHEPEPICTEEIELIHINEPEPICTEEIQLIYIDETEPTCTEEPKPTCSKEPKPICKSCRKPRAKPKKRTYTEEKLQQALEKVQTKALTILESAKFYDIPETTIRCRLRKISRKKTPPSALRMSVTKEEEILFKQHLIALNDMGIPVTFEDVTNVVKDYICRKGMKHTNIAVSWCKQFLERYEDLKKKIMFNEEPSKKRIEIDTTTVNDFFDRLQINMDDMSPDKIYNMDECGFEKDPEKLSLLFKRDSRHPELDIHSIKSMYTVVFCGNAIGELMPPFFIFKENYLSCHSNTSSSSTGWIDTDVFEHWLEKHFLPRIKDKPGKKVLICDNMSAHVSIHTLQMCVENDIKLICPTSNSSRLHPFDVEYYEYLQSAWRTVLKEWHETVTGQLPYRQKNIVLPNEIFYDLVNKSIDLNDTTEENIVSGFKKSGIFPLSRYAVLQIILEQELEEYSEY